MATTGPVQITCPVCSRAFTVPTEVVRVEGHQVLVRMDRSELYGHLADCAAKAGDQAGQAAAAEARRENLEPAAPPPAYVAKGNRPCTMCATTSPACMESLRNSVPCCGACGEGNTHPTPRESMSCAAWAAEYAGGRK